MISSQRDNSFKILTRDIDCFPYAFLLRLPFAVCITVPVVDDPCSINIDHNRYGSGETGDTDFDL